MNMGKKSNKTEYDPQATGEAERWFIRLLDPDCTESERSAFERWRADNAAHTTAYQQAEQLWAMSDEAIRGDPALAQAAQRALHEPKRQPRHRHWLAPIFAAIAVVLALTLLFVPNWLARHATASAVYSTAIGQQQTITLTDGSSILLDTNSKVLVHYSHTVRHVTLLRGRAQFSVHGDRQWPFVVHARDGTITAVGTKFQVDLNRQQVDVTLLEGRLAIATRANSKVRHAILTSQQQLYFDGTGVIGPVHPADMTLAKGWTTGKLFVHDWHLPTLLTEMNRYSTTQVVIGDPSLRSLRISGVFHVGDQKTLVLSLEKVWPIQATRPTPNHVVLWRK